MFLQFLAPTQKQWEASSVYQHEVIYLTPLIHLKAFRNPIPQYRLKDYDFQENLQGNEIIRIHQVLEFSFAFTDSKIIAKMCLHSLTPWMKLFLQKTRNSVWGGGMSKKRG